MNVVISVHNRFDLWNWPAWAADALRRDFPGVQVHHLTDPGERARVLPEADILVASQLHPDQFALARRLRWIHSPAAAVHQLLFPALVASPVVVTNGREVHGWPVAEHALAMMLALSRSLPAAVRAQARHAWAQQEIWQRPDRPGELRGATVVLVGLGAIGGNLARMLKALGATVLGVRAHPERGAAGADEVHAPDALEALLPRADYLVLASPVTATTERLLDRRRLALLPAHARLINVGRGSLVDEAALAEALQAGRLRGAALDVFAHEPLAPASPLWDLNQVLIVPHLGSATEALWQRQLELFEENLRRFLDGEPLLHLVEKSRGY
ncbi:MAG TPA: D-2-hydroxyacid dehydrogenase [Terriglobales bacterium]|nr:D-2-hydroxyacid dehydrogenase [Terriglobales bacterium]